MMNRSVGHLAGRVDAVLSQNFIQHGGNLGQRDIAAFDETGHQLNVMNRLGGNARSAVIFIRGRSC